ARAPRARHVRRPRHRAAVNPSLRRAIVAATMMMATILVILDVTIANVALDHMRGTLSAAVDEITWVLTAFLVANAISGPITGWLTDLLGRKRLFIVATVAFTLTSAAAGAAPSLAFIVIARFLQGLAGGPLVPLSQATMMQTFPASQRGMAMAVWGIGIMFAPIVGPTLGGRITDNWSWRWVFYINVPVGAVAVLLAWLFVPDSTEERPAVRRVDVPGLVLLVTGVAALQFVLDRGQREDWFASSLIVWLSIVAAVALVALVVRELSVAEPVVDLRVLRHPTFAVATSAMFVISIAFYGIFNFIRTAGGSIGIATMATLLQRGAQVHQARLVTHVSLYDPDVWNHYQTLADTFAERGADAVSAEGQALASLYEMVQREALSLSFIDNFWRLAWIFAAVVPFVLFLGRRPRVVEAPADVE